MFLVWLSVVASSIVVSFGASDANTVNYFIDAYENGLAYYAYPMDICLETGILNKDTVMYSCSMDSTTVTKTFYEDDCSGPMEGNSSIEFTDADTWDNGVYAFNCGGLTSYVAIEICGNDDTCGNGCLVTGTTYSAVNVCGYGGDGTNDQLRITTCDGDGANISTYTNQTASGCTNVAGGITPTVLTSEPACSYFYDVYVAQFFTDVSIYTEMTTCVLNGVEQTPSPTESPSSAPRSLSIASPILFVSMMAIIKMFA